MSVSLQDIDTLRERLPLTYAQARDALVESGGDVVNALALAESRHDDDPDDDGLKRVVREITEEARRSLSAGQVEGIRVKLGNETVGEVPVVLAGVGALLVALLSLVVGYLRLEPLRRAAPSDRTETS